MAKITEFPNLTERKAKVKLTKPFYFNGHKGRQLVTHFGLKRMMAPEQTQFKNALQNMEPSYSSFWRIAYTQMDLMIDSWYGPEGEIVDAAPHVLLKEAPVQNFIKILIFGTLLQRGTGLVTTAYKHDHPRCGKTSLFDLDPDSPMPDKIERGQALMQDVREFIYESASDEPTEFYEIKFPQEIHLPKEVGEIKSVSRCTVKGPTIGNYLSALNDPRKESMFELYVIWDNIISFDDCDEDNVKEIKKKNGFDSIFGELELYDFRDYIQKVDENFVEIRNDVRCLHCGDKMENVPFDMSNFFAIRRRTA